MGSCLAASPKTTPLKGFINTTFHCPIERGMCVCACVQGCAAAAATTYYHAWLKKQKKSFDFSLRGNFFAPCERQLS